MMGNVLPSPACKIVDDSNFEISFYKKVNHVASNKASSTCNYGYGLFHAF